MAKQRKGNKTRDIPKDVSMPTGVRKVSPRGASLLIAMPKSKKKVGMYGLI